MTAARPPRHRPAQQFRTPILFFLRPLLEFRPLCLSAGEASPRSRCARRQLLAAVASGLSANSDAKARQCFREFPWAISTTQAQHAPPLPAFPWWSLLRTLASRLTFRRTHTQTPRCPFGGPLPCPWLVPATCTPPCPAGLPRASPRH